MMASMTVTAMAAEPTPRYVPCDYCANGRIQESYYYKWDMSPYDQETYPCVHNGEHLRDVKWYYGRQVVLECGSCGYWDSYFLPGSEWKYAGHLGYSSLD